MIRFARCCVPAVILMFAALFAMPILVRMTHEPAIAQQTTVNGVPNQAIIQPGVLPLYNPNGTPITNGRCVQAIVNSTTSGTWSVDYTAMGFTQITSFRADAANPSTSTLLSQQYYTAKNPPTTTAFSGTVLMTVSVTVATISVPILQLATTSVPVSVGVCGS